MAEIITLNTPIAQSSIINYKPHSLMIYLNPAAIINVYIVNNLNEVKRFDYPSPVGTQFDTHNKVLTLINNLNAANLTTRSLWQRIFDRLLIDFPGEFNGGGVVS